MPIDLLSAESYGERMSFLGNARIHLDASETLIEIAPGVTLPESLTATVMGDDPPYDVEVALVFEQGRLVCESLLYRRPTKGARRGQPITGDGIHKIPVGKLTRAVAWHALEKLGTPFHWPTAVELRQQGSDALAAHVALLYRFAYAVGDPPTQTVADRLDMAYSTASGWIARAREMELLPKTAPGKVKVN